MPGTTAYFQRFGFDERRIEAPVPPDLGICVVIPCINEPDIIDTLDALFRCERPKSTVEILVVVNHPESANHAIVEQNRITVAEAENWKSTHNDPRLIVHLIEASDLPPRHAGAGLARKIGMDEALRRFDQIGRLEGIITGFDGDTLCDADYLTAIEFHFQQHPETPGCSIYFEHPLAGPLDSAVYQAVARYELHLRYYVNALRWAGLPYAFQTIGSSMAVRASAYMKQGGMNRRKAGEDFYFLHKIIARGHFTELNTTRVIPSPRPSDRVPFGTGKAVRGILDGTPFVTYPWKAFEDLKRLVEALPSMTSTFREPLQAFLKQNGFETALAEIRANTTSPETFRRRFFGWFDAFRAMKYIHHARDTTYGHAEVSEAAAGLWRRLENREPPEQLLEAYRQRDRR